MLYNAIMSAEKQLEQKVGFFERCVQTFNETWFKDKQIMHESVKNRGYIKTLFNPSVWLSNFKMSLAPLWVPLAETRRSMATLLG